MIFYIFCFNFGAAVAKIFSKYKKIFPEKSFWKLLSFVHPAKTTVGLIVNSLENCGFGGMNKTQEFPKIFFGDIFLYLLNIFATSASKLKQKIAKIVVQF